MRATYFYDKELIRTSPTLLKTTAFSWQVATQGLGFGLHASFSLSVQVQLAYKGRCLASQMSFARNQVGTW